MCPSNSVVVVKPTVRVLPPAPKRTEVNTYQLYVSTVHHNSRSWLTLISVSDMFVLYSCNWKVLWATFWTFPICQVSYQWKYILISNSSILYKLERKKNIIKVCLLDFGFVPETMTWKFISQALTCIYIKHSFNLYPLMSTELNLQSILQFFTGNSRTSIKLRIIWRRVSKFYKNKKM